MTDTFEAFYEALKRDIEQKRIQRSNGWKLTRKQQEDYSLRNVFRSLTQTGSDCGIGFETELSSANRNLGSEKCTGFFVPWEVGLTRNEAERVTRDGAMATVYGSGGATVQTDLSSTITPLLRNKTVALRLGATVIDRLQGNLALPRQTAPSEPGWVPETGNAPQNDLTFDQITMAPARLSCTLTYSRQLLLQSSASIEAFLRKDLMTQIGIVLDQAILNGQGGNSQPCGILNTPGISQEIFASSASWAQLVNFEQVLAAANGDQTGPIAWAMTPAVRNKWKTIAKTGVGVTSVVPIFLWDDGQDYGDGTRDGRVNGYRAAVTNSIPNGQVLFGNWETVIVAVWGDGVDIIVNPFTLATSGRVQLTANFFCQVALRHPQEFVCSLDSGAQ